MYDEAQEIFEYLPKDAGSLAPYIDHLWGAFVAVMEKDDPVRPFGILPYHLLFMFAAQYKVYRLSAHNKEAYLLTLDGCHMRDVGERKVLADNPPIPDVNGIVPAHCSVRNLSLIPEGKLFGFLRAIGLEDEVIEKARGLVGIRGTYAHANGNIEENIEARVDEYIEVLRRIQEKFTPLNDIIADEWLGELVVDEDRVEFARTHSQEKNVCPADFKTGKLALEFSGFIW